MFSYVTETTVHGPDSKPSTLYDDGTLPGKLLANIDTAPMLLSSGDRVASIVIDERDCRRELAGPAPGRLFTSLGP